MLEEVLGVDLQNGRIAIAGDDFSSASWIEDVARSLEGAATLRLTG